MPELANLSTKAWTSRGVPADAGAVGPERLQHVKGGDRGEVVDFIRVGRYDVVAWFKPLLVRAGIQAYRFWAVHLKLFRAGFHREIAGSGVVFYVRVGTDIRCPPLYIFHGLGLGDIAFNISCVSIVPPSTAFLPCYSPAKVSPLTLTSC